MSFADQLEADWKHLAVTDPVNVFSGINEYITGAVLGTRAKRIYAFSHEEPSFQDAFDAVFAAVSERLTLLDPKP